MSPKPSDAHYVSAAEASRVLGISPGTLYSYVSRGMLHSQAASPGSRQRRYLREDVERLKSRKELRNHPDKAAQQALRWGQPVMESSITLVANGRCYYRGHDVAELAATRTLEEVAGLIWLNDLGATSLFESQYKIPGIVAKVLPHLRDLPPLGRFEAVLPLAQEVDAQAFTLTTEAVPQVGARILRLLTAVAGQGASPRFHPTQRETSGVAATLQEAWSAGDMRARSLISTALVCMADHELNVSSFTARCVASAGAGPYQVVSGALAALHGWKHGGATELTAQLVQDAAATKDLREFLTARQRLGQYLPGFGQQLYPAGDPRAAVLFERMIALYPRSAELALARQVAASGEELSGQKPNVDFALATLCHVLHLNPGSGITLFALGRTVGWIGHAMEQYERHELIRPRAHYTGLLPTASSA